MRSAQKGKPKITPMSIAEAVLLLLVVYYGLHMVMAYGSTWDNIASYFNTLTMAGQSHYYEIFREPLIQLVMLPTALATGSFYATAMVTTAVMSILFFLAVRKLAASLHLNGISAYSISLGSIVIGFMTLLNLTDIFAAITAILALAYFYEGKNMRSGLLFGLSFLAKFTNLIFLPLFPFLFRGRELAKALGIAIAVNVPFMLQNLFLYGNPFHGYLEANQIFSSSHTLSIGQLASSIVSFLALDYQFIIVLAALGLLMFAGKITRRGGSGRAFAASDYALVAIALIEYIYVGSAQGFVAWLGYPIYVALLVLTIKYIRAYERVPVARNTINIVAYAIAAALVLASILYSSLSYGPILVKPMWFSKAATYNSSLALAESLGCSRIYSNAWPYLMLHDPSVLSVFDGSISQGSCVVMFNYSRVGTEFNITGVSTLYSSTNFSVLRKE